ncbi:MAG: class I SAM-dependent methyltransferase [Candidatus Levybacteria bacterium]|nr:class I SAM-dependent methyltransferase [Candidatus Levybacteria bacterium]
MKNLNHDHVIEQVPPDYYQKGVKENLLQKFWHSNKLKEVKMKITSAPENMLDVGCASGWLLHQLSKEFPRTKCYGIDIYKKAIDYGKGIYPSIKFKASDAHKIPYENNTFDLVICTEVLEHTEDPKMVLFEIKRVLKNTGIAIIEIDSGSWLFSVAWFLWRKINGRVWNDSHLHSFNLKKLDKALKACGYRVISKNKFNFGMAMIFTICKE